MKNFEVNTIGTVCHTEDGSFIKLEPQYIPAMQALEGFGHLNIIWWFSDSDTPDLRSLLTTTQPYKGAPEIMGIFATRSPLRPNPIALTACKVLHIDCKQGFIQVAFIDATNGTPVLDIKPYTPSFDRVESPRVPDWCSHWPISTEESGCFNWEKIFNF